MRLVRCLLICAVACSAKDDDSADNTDKNLASDGPWQLITDEIEGGVLLGAWSDGPTLRIVGGDLGGGTGLMVHGDADELCVEQDVTERALWWIHGDQAGEWTAVGEAGTVLRSTGGVRTRMDVPTDATLFGVHVDADQTWVAGGHVGSGENSGEIWRHDGEQWHAVASNLPHVLFKVWGPWFVGQDIAYRLDADTETLEEFSVDGRLLTVSGASKDDAWAVGGLVNPLILHFNGEEFEPVSTTGLSGSVNGVFTGTGEDVWIGGNYGMTARWQDERWDIPSFPLTSDHLHAVWRHQGATWWVGGDLFNSGANHGTIIRHSEDGRVPLLTNCE